MVLYIRYVEEDPDAGKDGRQKEKRATERWLDNITDSVDMNLSKLWEMVKDRKSGRLPSTRSQRVRHDLATEQPQKHTDW